MDMSEFIDQPVLVITNDGRNIVGIMRGIDQLTNIIIEDCHERVYTSSGVSTVELGVYLARGDNIAVIGELDQLLDGKIDLKNIRAEPLRSIVH